MVSVVMWHIGSGGGFTHSVKLSEVTTRSDSNSCIDALMSLRTLFEKWVKYANEMADDVIH